MAVRRHLIVLLVLAGLASVIGGGLALVMARGVADTEAALAPVLARADAAATLERLLSHYGEAVTSVILVGDAEMEGVQAARVEVTRALARLNQTTQALIVGLSGADRVADALPGLEDAQRIAELYYAIDRAANEAISNHRQMQTAVAVQILSRDVTFRLENEVRPLLLRALEVASDDAALIRREAGTNRDRLGLFAGLVLAGSLVGAGVAGFGLVRALRHADQQRTAHVAAADALRLALEAERALDTERRLDFFADASHELRTPLTILRGEADIGLRGAAGAVQLRQSLERVRTQAEAMSDLLEDLLSLAREDADYRDSAPTDVELDALVDAARDEGSLLADAREVRVIRAGGTDGAILLGRARRLKRALLIGLDNAIKHTPPGGDVRIETALEPDHAIIRIIDAGPGIAEDEKPRLFERFFRGRGEADLENHGLGIGLSIAREIVLSHGGTISLDNGPGQGAILTIALPTVPSQPGVTA